MKIELTVGKKYKSSDIFPEGRKGNLSRGHFKYEDQHFIFCNIDAPGVTGHDYGNELIGNTLVWYSSRDRTLVDIKDLIGAGDKRHIFTRKKNNEPFTYQGHGVALKTFNQKPAKVIWDLSVEQGVYIDSLPEEISLNSDSLIEGAKKQITINAYERNPEARKRCVNHYGFICSICSFDFEEKYGELGRDFIHVHHLVSLGDIGKEYVIDPIKDLIPICPNCHAMIHRKKKTLTEKELRDHINR